MSKPDLERRGLLRLLGLAATCAAAGPAGRAWAQAPPAPPTPPGVDGPAPAPAAPKDKTISLQSYEQWLRQVEAAAKEVATETGEQLEAADLRRIDDSARKTLGAKGYKVPLPPTNLRVQ